MAAPKGEHRYNAEDDDGKCPRGILKEVEELGVDMTMHDDDEEEGVWKGGPYLKDEMDAKGL